MAYRHSQAHFEGLIFEGNFILFSEYPRHSNLSLNHKNTCVIGKKPSGHSTLTKCCYDADQGYKVENQISIEYQRWYMGWNLVTLTTLAFN